MPISGDVTLQPHQQRVKDLADKKTENEDPLRMLVVHGMGTGKTLTSLAAAESLKEPYTAIVPAALRKNYTDSQDRFVIGGQPGNVVSYNKMTKDPDAIQGNTLIFDEAQRLTSKGSLQSQAAKMLADKAKNVILLSGTPMRNDPSELAPLVSLITGKNISHDEFRDKFITMGKHHPGGLFGRIAGMTPEYTEKLQNQRELKNLLQGKIDYYKPETHSVDVKTEVHEADMHPDQVSLYKAMFSRMPFMTRWKLKNNYPLKPKEYLKLQHFLSGPRQVGISTLPYMGNQDPFKAFRDSGKLQQAYGKLKDFLNQGEEKKAIIYSNFINAGLVPYASGLKAHGIPHGIFHGGLNDKERKKLVDDFNNNKIRVAFIGPSGSEGISLKGAQLTQVLDPHWHESRTSQAAARGVRFDSHLHLPEDQRHMTVQHFVSRVPPGRLAQFWHSIAGGKGGDLTVDHYLRRMGEKKQKLINEVEDELRRISELKK